MIVKLVPSPNLSGLKFIGPQCFYITGEQNHRVIVIIVLSDVGRDAACCFTIAQYLNSDIPCSIPAGITHAATTFS